jgi:AsmA protein
VELDGLRVHLIRNAQGKGNWVGLLGDAESASNIQTAFPPPASQAARKPGAGHAPVAGLAVAGIELVNARVDWEDQRTAQRFSVDKLDVTSGTVIPGQPMDLKLSGEALKADSGILARFTGTGTVTLDADLHRLAVEPLEVRIDHLQTAEGLSATAKISAKLKGDLEAGRYAVDDLKIAAEVDGKRLSGQQITATAGARVDLDLAAETLKVTDLAIRSDALQITGNSEGQHILSAPAYSGRLALPELDLRAWLEQHGLPLLDTADPEALRRFALTAGWRLAGARLAFRDVVVTLDQSRMTGSAEVLQTARPGYRFDLSVDKLDLDRYVPDKEGSKHLPPANVAEKAPSAPSDARAPAPVAAKVSPQQTPGAASPSPAPPPAAVPTASGSGRGLIPVTTIRGLDAKGTLRIGELRLAGVRFGGPVLDVAAKDGDLNLLNQVPRFYGGRLDGRIGIDARAEVPKVAVAQQASGIQLGPLLRDLTGEERLTGTGDLSADLGAPGQSADALRHGLGGKLAIHVNRGAVKGFDLERMVREAGARLKGESPPAAQGPQQTEFTELRASAVVQDGVLNNNDLLATSRYLRVTGGGTVDLGNERFNYRFEPMFVKPPEGRAIKELENVPIPVRLTGSFQHPTWSVDLGDAIKAVGRRELEKQLDEKGGDAIKRLEERTGIKGLEKGLRSLFGR